jgi:hypothetical protein
MSNTAVAQMIVEALASNAKARDLLNQALALCGIDPVDPPGRERVAQRTTGTQIMAVLASHDGPMSLGEIADCVAGMRRGEDEPRKQGGTRYQEMCRTSIVRLIERGMVERVEPETKRGLMRFERRA